MDIGTRIREARKSKGLSQIELAQIANIAVNSLRLYEANKRHPRTDTLQAIASALGIPVYELYGGVLDGDSVRFERDIDPEDLRGLPGYIEGENGQFSVEPGSDAEKKLREIIIGTEDQEPSPPDKARLDAAYEKLNQLGQKEAVKRVEELAEIKRYRKEKTPADGE